MLESAWTAHFDEVLTRFELLPALKDKNLKTDLTCKMMQGS
jgi:hypothetical protein